MLCEYCGNNTATCEVEINEEESIHLCWYCERSKDAIVRAYQQEKIGCQNCKYFKQDDYHQSGYGSVHHYWCRYPVKRMVKYPIGMVEETWTRGELDKPKSECEDAVFGKPERWIQHF